jgi:hypothetical protein
MNWIGLASDGQLDCDQLVERCMLANEAAGQYRQQIGARKGLPELPGDHTAGPLVLLRGRCRGGRFPQGL